MIEILLAVLQVILSWIGAREIGRLISRLADWTFSNRWLKYATESAIGLMLLSYVIFALQLLGIVGRASALSLLGLLALIALPGILRSRKSGILNKLRLTGPTVLWIVGLSIYGSWIVLQTTLPPMGIDELTYHLAVPKQLLASGGDPLAIDNVYAYFPQMMDMFFLYALPLGGETAAKLFHALFLGLIGMAIYGYSRETLDESDSMLATAAFLSIPSAMHVAGLAYVDLAFTLFAFLAVVFVLQVVFCNDEAPPHGSEEGGSRRSASAYLVLAGLMVGGAWATKYTGLQLLLLLALVFLINALATKERKSSWRALLIPAIAAGLFAPYALRNFVLTGWPLFPFSFGPLHLADGLNWDVERSQLFLQWLSGFGGSTGSWLDSLTAPVRVFVSARFNDLSAFDGVVGLVFLLIPILVIRPRRTHQVQLLLIFSLVFMAYWSITTRQVRFLLPLMPVLSFLLAWGVSQTKSQALRIIVLLLIAWNAVEGVRHQVSVNPQPFWMGRETRDQFLQERINGYPLYREANARLDKNDSVYLVNMGNFVYFLDVNWRADFVFEYFRLGRALEAAQNPGDLLPFFQSQNVTHLMMNEGLTVSPQCLPDREQRILAEFLREHTTLLAANSFDKGQKLRRINYE